MFECGYCDKTFATEEVRKEGLMEAYYVYIYIYIYIQTCIPLWLYEYKPISIDMIGIRHFGIIKDGKQSHTKKSSRRFVSKVVFTPKKKNSNGHPTSKSP